MVGCDHEGRLILKASSLHCCSKDPDAAIHLGNGGFCQVMGGTLLMLSFVRCQKVNRNELRLVPLDGTGGGLSQNHIRDGLELRIIIVALVEIDGDVRLAKLSEKRRVESLRAGSILHLEDLYHIEID